MKIGILPLGRPTFDVPLAEEKLSAMLSTLKEAGHELVGPSSLLMDLDQGRQAVGQLAESDIDGLLALQVTFTDASLVAEASAVLDVPMAIWAVPEPREGGRLRLNSFCGLNLASHALSLRYREFSWLFADPQSASIDDITSLLSDAVKTSQLRAQAPQSPADNVARTIVENVHGKRIGRIGAHPDGFDTCAYDREKIHQLTGVTVEEMELPQLFERAGMASAENVADVRRVAAKTLSNLDDVDQDQLDKSLRLKVALDAIKNEQNYHAFALRCWPETFTDYGGAVCGPVSMLGENKIPCACEADVYGALTQLILQETSGECVFLTDLVDMDIADNTGVVWHCGQAPLSMRDENHPPTATVHTNRKMPLLYEFPLKPGRVTLMRISQGYGHTKMILSGGEILSRPMAFTGTSGIVRFDRSVREVLPDIMNSGMEHHMALCYGDHRETLRGVAAAMKLPLLEI